MELPFFLFLTSVNKVPKFQYSVYQLMSATTSKSLKKPRHINLISVIYLSVEDTAMKFF